MKISVLVSTYNQEKYIRQALHSVLMQQVDCDFEIVINEDASTDRTQAIILDCQSRYPHKVRLLLADRVGAERDRARGLPGKTNFIRALKACGGQYVALLDGDDYWTDIHKLQKQVDFLDSHRDFAISCHNVSKFYEDGSKEPANLLPPNQREVSSLEDLLFDNFIPTCSVVFRRGLFGELPEWFVSLKLGDWPLHILNAQHGKIGYISEVMAVYRVRQGGLWLTWHRAGQLLELIKMLDHVDAYLDFRYMKQIRAAKANWYFKLAEIALDQGDQVNSRIYLRKYFSLRGFNSKKRLLSLFFRLETPTLYRRLKALKDFVRAAASNKHYEHLH